MAVDIEQLHIENGAPSLTPHRDGSERIGSQEHFVSPVLPRAIEIFDGKQSVSSQQRNQLAGPPSIHYPQEVRKQTLTLDEVLDDPIETSRVVTKSLADLSSSYDSLGIFPVKRDAEIRRHDKKALENQLELLRLEHIGRIDERTTEEEKALKRVRNELKELISAASAARMVL